MNTFNQNTAVTARDQALVPSPHLIDGRTRQDWLAFIADFASLINFYDANNNVNGNWAPFLLKDPVVLLASISRTNVARMHSLYLQTCTQLEQAFETGDNTSLGNSFAQLFDQLFRLFACIERWIYFMLKSNSEFGLKKFIIYQVETVYSALLWALVALRKQLIDKKMIPKLTFDHVYFFADADPKIWNQSKDKMPFWEILNLNHPPQSNTLPDIFNALKTAGDALFAFFDTVVQQAKIAFEKLQTEKINFPDTALVRAFVNLLMIHRDQLNGLTQKHLDFYYSDILNLHARNAEPDHVIITADPADKTLPFYLKKGSLFDAGTDAQKKPVVFSTVANASLNPCSIVGAHTIAALKTTPTSLFHQVIAAPSVLQKDGDGKIMGWPSFGGSCPPFSTPIAMGFAIASPLLLLREGNRSLKIVFTFDTDNVLPMMQSAHYFLSTKAAWLPVIGRAENAAANGIFQPNRIVLRIDLEPTQPPVENFLKNPDGFASDWPLLKVSFDAIPAKDQSPVLQSLSIDATVSNLATFQLYNDFGALSMKSAFAPFGPTPLANNSFLIGNSEILSKPLQALHIGLTWESVPPDFQQYYQEYNNYIAYLADSEKHHKKTVHVNKLGKKIPSVGLFKKIGIALQNALLAVQLESMELLGIPPKNPSEPYNNGSFCVGFEVLQNNEWNAFPMKKQDSVTAINDTITIEPYVAGACVPAETPIENLLFSTDDNCVLTNSSYFSYESQPENTPPAVTIDAFPNLQNAPLQYSDGSANGFLKMTLTEPATFGFGSGLYPEIVAYTALQNALLISRNPKRKPSSLIAVPKLPFVPKLKGFTAHYKASQLYDFTQPQSNPLQCFAYSAFAGYQTYDNADGHAVINSNAGDAATADSKTSGIALFPALHNYQGFLYLELAQVVAPSEINLYVELARKYGNLSSGTQLDYYYLANNGWQLLEVVSDGTNNFSCSGIVTVKIPGDISNETHLMPGKNYWICVATKNDVNLFPEIVFLKTNGIELVRNSDYPVSDIPKIPAGVIMKAHAPIPQITAIAQPFPSFAGKASEDETARNKRVSNRLKTKDRVVANEDFFRLIQQEFADIYYSKVHYEPETKTTNVYVVKGNSLASDANAFAPMVSECQELEIQKYMQERASAFAVIKVSNFSFSYVTVNATITIHDGYEIQTIQRTVQKALDLFLSPWISGSQTQITIDQNLTDIETAAFIKSIDGVMDVGKLFFNISDTHTPPLQSAVSFQTIVLGKPGKLIVSGQNHVINQAA